MLIREYGLFWEANEVDWHPGKGNKGAFRLLGRIGKNAGTLKLADFRHTQGIYILYGNYGPYYVGLTQKQGLGKRLKDHLTDQHKAQWDRFCWFGFQQVLKGRDVDGIHRLRALGQISVSAPATLIREVEGLLIKAMGTPGNASDTKFKTARHWVQVRRDEIDTYLAKA